MAVSITNPYFIQYLKDSLNDGTANIDGFFFEEGNYYYIRMKKGIELVTSRSVKRTSLDKQVYRVSTRGMNEIDGCNFNLMQITFK